MRARPLEGAREDRGTLGGMRSAAALLLLSLSAAAAPPLSPGFVRLRDLRENIRLRSVEIREREEFDAKPREERMLLTFRKRGTFEGKALLGKLVVETCLGWEDVERAVPTEAGQRVLKLLPDVLHERCGPDNRKERRVVSQLLLKALDSDFLPVREAAIASLRRLYGPPRADRYDPAAKDRRAAIRARKRAVWQQNG